MNNVLNILNLAIIHNLQFLVCENNSVSLDYLKILESGKAESGRFYTMDSDNLSIYDYERLRNETSECNKTIVFTTKKDFTTVPKFMINRSVVLKS